jgi:phosphoenolpyruvate carboxylase
MDRADRDGNPNVTPEVTLHTIDMLQDAARQTYLEALAHLEAHLTQSMDEVPVSDMLRFSIAVDKGLASRYPRELYRQKLALIARHLAAGEYVSSMDLLADLRAGAGIVWPRIGGSAWPPGRCTA